MKSIINRVIALLVLFTMVAAPVSANDTFQADKQDLKQERSSFVSVEPLVSTDIPALVKFEAHRDADRATIRNLLAPAFTSGNVKESGLVKATLDKDVRLNPDPTRSYPIDNLSQVFVKRVDVPANSIRMVAEITKTTAGDLDMFIYSDANDNGNFDEPDFSSPVISSKEPTALEYINGPKEWIYSETDETYFIVVQNYTGAVGNTFTLATGVVPLAPEVDNNYDVTIPSTRLADEPFQIDVFWNEDIEEGDRLYGYFETCADIECAEGAGLVGKTDLDVQRLVDDVVKTADVIFAEAGDTITYTIVITRRADVATNYTINDALPEGVTFVPGSLTEGAVYDALNRVVTWTGPVSSPGAPYYRVTDSIIDPSCDTGVFGGGYVNLADHGIFPSPDVFGDGKAWTLPDVKVPFDYYGVDYPTIALTDDGFAVFDVPANYLGSSANINQDIPDPIKPNAVIAPLWQDMEIEYSAALNQGLSIWSNEEGTVHIFEYDDIHLDNELSMTYDFEIVYNHVPDFTPGHPEIIFAYDNINGPLSAATIGVENFDGSAATLYAYENADLEFTDGHMICFNLFVPTNIQVITFQVTVDEDAALGSLVNVVLHDNDTEGTKEESASVEFVVLEPKLYLPIIHR
jgi:uncharacterized repeat protein (TIGR01451 family)